MACFADINVSQGSVPTYARCGGIFNMHLLKIYQGIFQWKNFVNRLRSGRIMVTSLGPVFGPPCILKDDIVNCDHQT